MRRKWGNIPHVTLPERPNNPFIHPYAHTQIKFFTSLFCLSVSFFSPLQKTLFRISPPRFGLKGKSGENPAQSRCRVSIMAIVKSRHCLKNLQGGKATISGRVGRPAISTNRAKTFLADWVGDAQQYDK